MATELYKQANQDIYGDDNSDMTRLFQVQNEYNWIVNGDGVEILGDSLPDYIDQVFERVSSIRIANIRSMVTRGLPDKDTYDFRVKTLLECDDSARLITESRPDEGDLQRFGDKVFGDYSYNNTKDVIRMVYESLVLLWDEYDRMIIGFSENRYLDDKKKIKRFSDIIQYTPKEKLLKRLHELIDGKGGALVGSIIMKAKFEGYLMQYPTQAQFRSEFELIGTWQGISNYFNENSEKALDKANKIVIFEA